MESRLQPVPFGLHRRVGVSAYRRSPLHHFVTPSLRFSFSFCAGACLLVRPWPRLRRPRPARCLLPHRVRPPFSVQSSRFKVQGSKFSSSLPPFSVQSSRFKVQGSKFSSSLPPFSVQSSRFKVQGSRFSSSLTLPAPRI